jgi:anaerobic selenocysteine-containing dehydrogenase
METINRMQAEESSAATATAITFIMQLQETAKKAAKEAALLKDLQEGQEDDVITYNGFY